MEKISKQYLTSKKNKRVFLSLLIIFFLLLGLAVARRLVSQRQELRKEASTNQVSLTLTSDQTNLTPGQSFDIKVLVDPPSDGSLKVTAVTAKLTYPTDKLTLNGQPVAGSFFLRNFTSGQTEMLNIMGTDSAGNIAINLGAPCTVAVPWLCYPQTAGGQLFPLATLNFTAKTGVSGAVQINFDTANTLVAALDSNNNPANNNQNVVDPASLNTLSLNITSPSTPTPTPANSPTPTPTPEPTATPTPTPTASPTPTPTSTPTPTPGPTATPTPTPIPVPETAILNFSVKLQGISGQGLNKNVKVILKNGQTFDSVGLTSDAAGIYSGTVSNVAPGTYEVLVKEPTHLQKNFGSVQFVANQTVTKDWASTLLKAGDLNSDGTIEGTDLSLLLGKIRQYNFELIPSGTDEPADLNNDHYVEGTDLSLMLSNVFQGDEQ